MGGHVKDLTHLQMLFLLALRPKRGRQQYQDKTLLALLQWLPNMDNLLAMAWSERKLEATISVLARESGGEMTAKNAQELHDLYITKRPTGDDVRQLDTNPMSKGYSAVVKSRVAHMMNSIAKATMPLIERGTVKQKYAKGEN